MSREFKCSLSFADVINVQVVDDGPTAEATDVVFVSRFQSIDAHPCLFLLAFHGE